MERQSWKLWAAAVLSAGLLELPFPIAGPLPGWRPIFAWFALIPLLRALLSQHAIDGPRPLRRGFLLGYLCGVLWYVGNCYWIYDTMLIHGGLPPVVSVLLLLGFSVVLGLYFGFFGFGVALLRRATGSTRIALAVAPFLWTALELAGARITSVPWDQLGYSQVDNALVNQLAPWTGVYGISFLLVAANAFVTSGLLIPPQMVRPGQPLWRLKALLGGEVWRVLGSCILIVLIYGDYVHPPKPSPTATAVLVQPNLDVAGDNSWSRPGEWEQHIAEYAKLSGEECKTYIAGIPETNAPSGEIVCPPYTTHPDLIAWPESPAPFFELDRRFDLAAMGIAGTEETPLMVGAIGSDIHKDESPSYYNSAVIIGADRHEVGRYDKIHLVPYGEYIPYRDLFFFAHKLTGKVSDFDRGTVRKVFILPTQNGQRHHYGVFICYEAVFSDEVRHFAQLGAEVLVNISDDGWYGDTSAPWQHLNMARMRAIENRRWILRDTNNGITAAIDPYGTVRQSIPRHAVDALPAQFGFRDDITFYTAHGDVFAWLCALLSCIAVSWAVRMLLAGAGRRA